MGIVIDNLKAAIVRSCWDDPVVQQSYRECAEHYGFMIPPCRPGTPVRKGKVEQGGVHYVKRNFLGWTGPPDPSRPCRRDHRRQLQSPSIDLGGTYRSDYVTAFRPPYFAQEAHVRRAHKWPPLAQQLAAL